MKRKCYNCGKIKEGDIVNGVFICCGCRRDNEDYGNQERQEQIDRLGQDGVESINFEE